MTLGSGGLLLFEDGASVSGGHVTINGSQVENNTSGIGGFGSSDVTIGGGARFYAHDATTLRLGTTNTVTYSASNAYFWGSGTLEPGGLNVIEQPTEIGEAPHTLTLDMDGSTGTKSWILNADLSLDVADTEASSDGFDSTITINNTAHLNIDQPGNFRMQGTFELNGSTIDSPSGTIGIELDETAVINANSGFNLFSMHVEFLDATSTVTVAPAAELRFETATFRGGTFTGGGLFRFGSSTVEAATTLSVDRLDLDYESSEHTLNAPLVIDADSIETLGGDGFDGSLIINGTTLDVNVSGGTFAMEGEFQLDSATIESTIDENTMTFGDLATIHANAGDSRFVLPVEFVDGSTSTTVADGASLWFDRGVTFRGGTFSGDGSLRAGPTVTVAAPTVIEVATINLDWGDWTIDANLTLDVDAIDTSVGDGFDATAVVNGSTFRVNTPWAAEGTIVLNDGILAGAEITNDGLVRGHGTVRPDGLVNNGTLAAAGGTLVIDNTAGPYDMDGATEDGTLVAFLGDMHLLGDLNSFDGTVNVGPGREFYVDGNFSILDNSGPGELHLGDATVRTTGFLWQQGNLSVTGSASTMEAGNLVRFINGGSNAIDADLRLIGGTLVQAGATFDGSGRLIINGSFIEIEDTGVVGVAVRNQGQLRIGNSPGTAEIHQYTQTSAGSYVADIDGLSVGTQYDQLHVTTDALLAGTLDVQINQNGGSYLDPAVAGQVDDFVLLIAGSVTGSFDEVMYAGELLVPTFGVGSDGDFVDHVGGGLFRILSYNSTEVHLLNYLALPGDANGDGTVDGQDFIVWNSHKFTTGTDWTTGDFTGDGITDGQDFIVWNENKFTSAANFVASVPEPGGWLLLLSCWIATRLILRR